jgi:hypothetical protein
MKQLYAEVESKINIPPILLKSLILYIQIIAKAYRRSYDKEKYHLEKEDSMISKKVIWFVLGFFILAVAACTTTVPTVDTDTFNTLVAQNVQLTQLAGTLTAVSNQVVEQSTTAAVEAALPTATATIMQPTLTPTLNGVWVSFNTNANCRFGPGTSYYLIKTFNTGDQAQVVGQSTDGQYLYVKYIDTSAHYCWVPLNLVTAVNGDVSSVAKITPYPTNTPTITPTSAASISLSFNGISNCGGNYYVRVLVTNTGYLTWKSIRIKVVDNDTGDKMIETSDLFTSYEGCAVDQQQSDLTEGEPGMVSNYSVPFPYDLDNESLTITVTVYSKDGQAGESVSATITVKP